MITSMAATLLNDPNSVMIQNAALTARSRRKLNNTPRICRWMEDIFDKSGLSNNFDLNSFPKPPTSASPDGSKHCSFLTAMAHAESPQTTHVPTNLRQSTTLLAHKESLDRLTSTPSAPSSDSGTSFSSIESRDVIILPPATTIDLNGRRCRPELTIAVDPSPPIKAKYILTRPGRRQRGNKSPSPYGPLTQLNGFPYFEPRSPAPAYIPPPPCSVATQSTADTHSPHHCSPPPQSPLPPPPRRTSPLARRYRPSLPLGPKQRAAAAELELPALPADVKVLTSIRGRMQERSREMLASAISARRKTGSPARRPGLARELSDDVKLQRRVLSEAAAGAGNGGKGVADGGLGFDACGYVARVKGDATPVCIGGFERGGFVTKLRGGQSS